MKLMKSKAGARFSVFGIQYTVYGLRLAAIATTDSREPKIVYRKPYTVVLLLLLCSLMTSSCGVYSFTGTTLSPTIKTVTVNNFVLATAGGPANLPLTFNERLKEYYQRYTNLKVVPANGDLVLEGNITGYELIAVAPTAQDQAGVNRLQITILVRFYNNKDETKNFEQPFSFYKDFPQSQTLSQNESRLVPQILDQIVLDIFNKTAADW